VRNAVLLLAASAAAAAAAGCVSLKRSPEARYFVLRPLAEPAAARDTPEESLLGLYAVRLPGSLARPQLVTTVAPGELRVDPLQRWAEPLDEGATRTLAENLAALLPRFRVVRAPWPAATPLHARLSVEVRSFGPQPDGSAGLAGSYVLLDPRQERALERQAFSYARPLPPGSGGAAAAEAMSALLADLARRVATAVEERATTPSGR
jgi:uncharacterized lipoprotein YmbA